MGVATDFDFFKLRALLQAAGLTVADAAIIFRVTRPTMYHWCEGHAPTQKLLLSGTLQLITAIKCAVQAKALPVHDVDTDKKIPAIVAVLRGFMGQH